MSQTYVLFLDTNVVNEEKGKRKENQGDTKHWARAKKSGRGNAHIIQDSRAWRNVPEPGATRPRHW